MVTNDPWLELSGVPTSFMPINLDIVEPFLHSLYLHIYFWANKCAGKVDGWVGKGFWHFIHSKTSQTKHQGVNIHIRELELD